MFRAASSPKNEEVLKQTIQEQRQKEKAVQEARTTTEQTSLGEHILRESFAQYDTSRRTPPIERRFVEPPPPPELPRQPKDDGENISSAWIMIGRYISQPSIVFLLLSILALSAYLIHQGILFFSTVDNDNVSAISSAVVSELLPLLCAACFALSVSKMQRFLSGLLLTGSIIGLSLFMHAALSQKQVDTSANVSHLEKQRENILLSIETLNAAAAALPSNFVSKKQDIIQQIDVKQASLSNLDTNIARAISDASSASNVLLSYGVWLRIAAMILNAILAHALFVEARLTFTHKGYNRGT